MAKTLDNTGIAAGQNILAGNVSQSIDAFTGDEEYDITISGSLVVTGSFTISGSDAKPFKLTGLTQNDFSNVVVQQPSNGNIYFTASGASLLMSSILYLLPCCTWVVDPSYIFLAIR